MTTHLMLYVTSENSHLSLESALAATFLADVATRYRFDGHDTRFPQECRRSGLNEGTIRK